MGTNPKITPSSSSNKPSPPQSIQSSINSPSITNNFPSIPIQNICNLIPLKLTKDNYINWKALFLHVLKGFDLLDHVEGPSLCPSRMISDTDGSEMVNPNYIRWHQMDQLLLIWFNSTISASYLPYVVGFQTARDLWDTLETRFSVLSRSHILQLRSCLQSVRKDSLSITSYLKQIKEIADSLAASGNIINDMDMVFYILNGLPPEYDSFSTSIRIRDPIVTSDELHSLLLTEELTLATRSKMHISDPSAFYTNYRNGQSSSSNRGRGHSNRGNRGKSHSYNNSSSRSPHNHNQNRSHYAPDSTNHQQYNKCDSTYTQHQNLMQFQAAKQVCQICQQEGHSAIDCHHRMNYAYVGRTPPPKLQAMMAYKDQQFSPPSTYHNYASSSTQSPWIMDTGATNHVSNDSSAFYNLSPYHGSDKLSVGNGDTLSIHNTGSGFGEDFTPRFS